MGISIPFSGDRTGHREALNADGKTNAWWCVVSSACWPLCDTDGDCSYCRPGCAGLASWRVADGSKTKWACLDTIRKRWTWRALRVVLRGKQTFIEDAADTE